MEKISLIKKKSSNENIIKAVLNYRYFLFQLVKRNFIIVYKQTILGRFWPIINIFLQSGVFTIIFSNLLKVPTDGVPPFIFYMCGMLVWFFFQSNTLKTSQIFTNFGYFFSAAYFPRILIPISLVIENCIFLIINFTIFISIYFLLKLFGYTIHSNFSLIIFLPLIFLYLSFLSFSIGLIISCLSAKYRDLALISNHGLQLLFFATPIVYSSEFLSGSFKFLYYINPVAYPVVLIKNIFFSTELLSLNILMINLITCVLIFCLSIFYFNKVSKNVVDYA
jgi:lipopolysaccharide transport system permease protein